MSCMDPCGDATPCVGSAPGLPIEGEDKTAGGYGGGGLSWFLCVCVVVCCVGSAFYFELPYW